MQFGESFTQSKIWQLINNSFSFSKVKTGNETVFGRVKPTGTGYEPFSDFWSSKDTQSYRGQPFTFSSGEPTKKKSKNKKLKNWRKMVKSCKSYKNFGKTEIAKNHQKLQLGMGKKIRTFFSGSTGKFPCGSG